MNTKNLAIMSTDIVGSSGTTAAFNRTDYEQFRNQYDRIVVPLIERTSGEIFKVLGDGYLASFESSTNAVLAGLDIQAQLKSLTESLLLDRRHSTRIGIGSGDVTIKGSDRFGVPVIQATRVQSIAEPSSTFITESVFLTMNRNEVSCEDLGYISLKGLEDKTRIFKVQAKGQGDPADRMAVLCTDIGSFTDSVDSGDDLEELLAIYDEVIFAQALRRNGFLRYNLGDMYLITFRCASDALDAARSMLRRLQQARHEPFQLGLDFGSVRTIRGRLYGSSLSSVAPSLAHEGAGLIRVSRRFMDEWQRENPSRPPPRPLWDNEEIVVRGTWEKMQYVMFDAGEDDDG